MTAVSALAILSLASFLGGVTKGVTGFGSAILNLCTWIAFKSCTRLDTGTLTQAVVCEALSSTLIAPGLLYVTRAFQTADFRLVAVVAFFVTVSSPIGAAVLAKLDAQQVELAMAFVLLVIIIVEHSYKLLVRHNTRKKGKQGMPDVEYDALTTHSGSTSSASSGSTWLEGRYHHLVQDAHHLNSSSNRSHLKEPLLSLVHHHDPKSSSNINSIPATAKVAAEKQAHSYDALDNVTGGPDLSADVTVEVVTSHDSSTDNAAALGDVQAEQHHDAVHDPTATAGRTCSSRRRCCAEGSWIRIVSIYSVAGLFSGVMEGLTGMNGPPLMIAYRSVNTPKATVRGSNAFLNLLQFRLVPYWYMGLITRSDLDLYVYTCATGLIGALIGNALSWKMNQAVFQKVLGVLMILCCFLMFISGLGILK